MLLSLTMVLAGQVGLTTDLAADPDPKISTRLDLSQLATADSVTDRNILFTDLRATFDGVGLLTDKLELHLDGRVRYGWNDISRGRYDLTHAYVQYGNSGDRFFAGLGRITVTELANVQVDGAQVGMTVMDGARVSLFGGLMPHPITRAIDPGFANVGAAFDYREKRQNHAGGLSVQLYEGRLDRVMLSERVYLRPHRTVSVAGSLVVDLLPQDGAAKNFDVTSAFLMVRYRPVPLLDVSVTASHVHALLPRRWWQDWVEQERQRRGFTLDGPAPVGTRRTNARMVANIHLGAFTPYVGTRYDHRHEDGAQGWEGRAGLKAASVGLGYADFSVAHRRYFETENQLAVLQAGLDVVSWLGIDAGGSVLRNGAPGQEAELLYDVNGSVWMQLFDGLYAMGSYQLFVDREMQFHMVLLRLGYRLRS